MLFPNLRSIKDYLMKKIFLFFLILVIPAILISFVLNTNNQGNNSIRQAKNESYVKINNQKIAVEIADSDQKRTQGLSNRERLDENSGMLFIFNPKSLASFWMKDMKFAIDIIWIKDNLIIKIDKNVPAPSPNTSTLNPKHYSPPSEINYVLEVNAGFSDRNNIGVGDMVNISI